MRERTTRLLIASVIGAVVAVVSNRVDAEFSSLRVSVASTVFNDILIGFVAGLCAFAWASLLTNRHFRRSLVKRMREEGVQRERARMAREIHDTFAQGLGGIVLSLEAAQDFLEQSPEAKSCATAPCGSRGKAWRKRARCCGARNRSKSARPSATR